MFFRSRTHRRAISPVIATVILLAVFIALVSAALAFVDTELTSYYANSDLASSSTFAQNYAQAVQSVGMTFGRSLSIGYGVKYAQLAFIPAALQYTITVGSQSCLIVTGFLLSAISASYYSLGKNYYINYYPGKFSGLSSIGASGSFARAFATEYQSTPNSPFFLDTVVMGIPQVTNFMLTTPGSSPVNITRIYLPELYYRNNPIPMDCSGSMGPSTEVTRFTSPTGYISAQGQGLQVETYSSTSTTFQITASATPAFSSQYPLSFYHFSSSTQTFHIQSGQEIQIFIGDIEVLGV